MSGVSGVAVNQPQQTYNPFLAIGQGIVHGVRAVVKGAKEIQGDVTNLARAIRIVGYLYALIVPASQAKLRAVINLTDGFVDAAQAVSGVNDLTKKTGPEDVPVLKKAADVAFLAAGVGSVVQFLDHVNIIELPTVASSTGSLGIFGKITKDSLGNAVLGVLAAAFTLLGVNAGIKLGHSIKEINAAKLNNDDDALELARLKRNQAILDLVFSVSEVAFFVLGIVAAFVTAVPAVALIILGMAAAGLGILAFLHSQHRDERIKELNTNQIN